MRPFALLVLAALLLAGCAGDGGSPTQAEPEADFGVEATATTGVIRGVVVTEAIVPLGAVNITLSGIGTGVAVTDSDGRFAFADLAPGTYFLSASKFRFEDVQTSVEVVAGDSEPPIAKIVLVAIPSLQPYVESYNLAGYLSFGAAVFATSVGTTVYPQIADFLGDRSIWDVNFTGLPAWAQGELVWQQTQPAGGQFIWEIVPAGTNDPTGYRETTGSPALAYWNTTILAEHLTDDEGNYNDGAIAFRFFGGPHPLCSGVLFGCGLTVQQKADAYVHIFYNFAPPEGWRFTVDGPPVVPA